MVQRICGEVTGFDVYHPEHRDGARAAVVEDSPARSIVGLVLLFEHEEREIEVTLGGLGASALSDGLMECVEHLRGRGSNDPVEREAAGMAADDRVVFVTASASRKDGSHVALRLRLADGDVPAMGLEPDRAKVLGKVLRESVGVPR